MSCDVAKVTEGLENEVKRRKGWRMSCDVGEVMERLENEQAHSPNGKRKKGWGMNCDVGEATEGLEALLILQLFRHFTYVTTHSPTVPSLYLHHSSFSNPSVASRTSQFILQPFFRFSYVTSSSLNSPGKLPMTKAVLISTDTS